MDRELKLAKMKARQAEHEETMAMARDILKNPIVELVGGFLLIQALTETTDPAKRPLIAMGTDTQIILRAGIVTAVAVQQLAPSLPILTQGASNIAGSLAKLIPALGA